MSSRNIKAAINPIKATRDYGFRDTVLMHGDPGDILFGRDASITRRENEAQRAVDDAAAHQRAIDMANQHYGGSGATATPSSGQGMMATPVFMMPQQQPNQGLPLMQGLGAGQNPNFASYLQQLRQNVPTYGYMPLMPRTEMPQPVPANVPPSQVPFQPMPRLPNEIPTQMPARGPTQNMYWR